MHEKHLIFVHLFPDAPPLSNATAIDTHTNLAPPHALIPTNLTHLQRRDNSIQKIIFIQKCFLPQN